MFSRGKGCTGKCGNILKDQTISDIRQCYLNINYVTV